MLRDRKVVSFPRKDAADPSSEAHHPARHRGRAVDLRAVLSNTAAAAHMWLFTVKLNKIQFLAHTNHISGAQEPQMVSERRAGQHRCRTLPPSQKVLLDGTVPDPDGSSATDAIAQRLAAQHVPAVVGGESRQCPTAAARQWWHSAASRPTPPASAREREAASPSYLLLMGAMGIRVACLERQISPVTGLACPCPALLSSLIFPLQPRLIPTVSLSPREHEGRCLRDNMNLSGTGAWEECGCGLSPPAATQEVKVTLSGCCSQRSKGGEPGGNPQRREPPQV
nr:uncharacterized protein LOC101136566 [Gorilla gorilla gorilla]